MQQFARRLMSGASLALLAFGGPSAARASAAKGPATQLSSALHHANTHLNADELSAGDAIAVDVTLLDDDRANIEAEIAGDEESLYFSLVPVYESLNEDYSKLESKIPVVTEGLGDEPTDVYSALNHAYTHAPALRSVPLLSRIAAISARLGDAYSDVETKVAAAEAKLEAVDLAHVTHLNSAFTHINDAAHHVYTHRPAFRTAATYTHTTKTSSANLHLHATSIKQHGASNHSADATSREGLAYAFASGAHHHAIATGIGVYQYTSAAGTGAKNRETNPGGETREGEAYAYATGTGTGVYADAYGHGILQKAIATGHAENYVSNDAGAFIGGYAVADAAHGTAVADATGVSQLAGGKTIHDGVVNDGDIEAFASAYGHVEDARAIAVLQDPAGKFVTNSATNSKVMFATAIATKGAGNAHLTADGIRQVASATSKAKNHVDNKHGATIAAFARFSGLGDVTEFVKGVSQYGKGVTAHDTVDNSGLIVAGGIAVGTTTHHGRAGREDLQVYGVYQGASATHPKNIFDNAKDGTVVAIAYASDGKAETADVRAVDQQAAGHHTGDTASNVLTNHGLLEAAAHAYDGTHAVYAAALGISEGAIGGGRAHNDVYNVGTVIAVAHGFSGGQGVEFAAGVEQLAVATAVDDNYLSNAGFIGASAHANSLHSNSSFFRFPIAGADGVVQFAGDIVQGAHTADNQLVNKSGADIVAIAVASHIAAGSAEAFAHAVEQAAFADPAYNSVSNHGFMGASAKVHNAVTAHAVAAGVSLDASAPGKASNDVHNYSHGSIVAFAGASHAHNAKATAHAVSQNARGHNAINEVTNAGLIGAQAVADAISGGKTHATARAYAIDEHASGVAAYATNRATNHGTMLGLAQAKSAVTVEALAKGVNQHAAATKSDYNFVSNAGLIAGVATARSAAGHETARAYGVDQHADTPIKAFNKAVNLASHTMVGIATARSAPNALAEAKGLNQVGYATKSATNYASNLGLIGGVAVVNDGELDGTAHAFAIEQRADAKYAKNTVLNHGTIAGFASATRDEFARATAYGIYQSGTATNAAHNHVTNSNFGLIAGVAIAHGSSLAADANAHAYGANQGAYAKSVHNSVNNLGTIAAYASASDAHSVNAIATGVDQYARGQTGENYVNNNGLIVAKAVARNGATGHAHARGVQQSATEPSVVNEVIDHGTIAAIAIASVSYAHATGQGLIQTANTAHPDNDLTNNANVSALAFANGKYAATASATGVRQLIGTVKPHPATAPNEFRNHAFVAAYAEAHDVYRSALADAEGVSQYAVGKNHADNFAANSSSGIIEAFAYAGASGVSRYARANAAGIAQFASASKDRNEVSNTKHAFVGAKATANAFEGHALAEGVGVSQRGFGSTVSNSVYNAGVIAAFATAVDARSAHAEASGIYQDPGAKKVDNTVENSGLVFANAFAGLAFTAKATAIGVHQSGKAHLVSNSVDNEGTTGQIVAIARIAAAAEGTARAEGIRQRANATTVHNTVYNSGLIEAGAIATMSGALHVKASADGVLQQANGSHLYNVFNNEPDGVVIAGAEASDAVTAYARAVGVYQSAAEFPPGYSGKNAATNFGTIEAAAIAYNAALPRASATGIFQSAEGEGKAVNDVYNGGVVLAVGSAYDGADPHAFAGGVVQVGIGHSAYNYISNDGFLGARAHASNGSHVVAVASPVLQEVGTSHGPSVYSADNVLVNKGGQDIVGVASANLAAQATVSAGAVQRAKGDPAYNEISNSGFMAASGYVHNAGRAMVTVAGAFQSAYAPGRKGINRVYNHDSATIIGFGHVYDASTAYAVAQGVGQFALAHTATNYVSNAGFIGAEGQVTGFRRATSIHDEAYLAGLDVFGIHQDMPGPDLKGRNSVVNSATVLAFASARTAHHVNAKARGIDQTALAHTATNYVHNIKEGEILAGAVAEHGYFYLSSANVTAKAYGIDEHATGENAKNTVFNTGIVFADAGAYSANFMVALAKGVNQHAAGASVADDYVSNGGLIFASAFARGNVGVAVPDLGSARAYGIDQHATGPKDDRNTVYNAGTVFARAAVNSALAGNAEAKGVNQVADARTGYNFVSNGGIVLAEATVHGRRAVAPSARAYGIDQHATAATAANTEKNDKVILAIAHATVGFGDTAVAKGVNQEANASTTAANLVTDKGLIAGSAHARSGVHGRAYAYGIDQHADTADDAYNTADNYLGGAVVAVATVYQAEFGIAEAKGMNQVADATSSAANYVLNDGFIGASARAYDSGAHAQHTLTAHAIGIEQRAVANEAFDSVVNHSAIAAYATAYNAPIVRALASGVYQHADKLLGASATNYLSNSGVIAGIAIARGAGVLTLSHDAYAYAYGADQLATAATHASNKVINGKTIAAYAIESDAYVGDLSATALNQVANGANAENYVANDGVIAGIGLAAEIYNANAVGVGLDQDAGGKNLIEKLSNDKLIVGEAAVLIAAYAEARGFGVDQSAHGSTVKNTAVNSGGIIGLGEAFGEGNAFVEGEGLVQVANRTALAKANSAYNTVTNKGLIAGSAYAVAGLSYADAYGSGVGQFAKGSSFAIDRANNKGTIEAVANAYGSAAEVFAQARGIGQFATADGTVGEAANYVSNTGVVVAQGGAFQAHFVARDYALGVSQIADNTSASGIARNEVHNKHFIGAFASASSAGDVYASAKGVNQSAHAGLSAFNTVTNHGAIVAVAHAHGGVDFSHGHITSTNPAFYLASAKAYGVDQHNDPQYAYNSATNDGLIAAIATAEFAHEAVALAKGVNQHAYGSNSAGNKVFNYGAGLIEANALALGTDFEKAGAYTASARAYGIDQHAIAGSTAAHNLVENYGAILANASAVEARGDFAEAKGVNQVADTANFAQNVADNYSGLIHAHAYATGFVTFSSSRHAEAFASGIDQRARGGSGGADNTAYLQGYHTGTGKKEHQYGAVVASAFASSDNFVGAGAKGVNQTVTAFESAYNYVTNDPALILASAHAEDALIAREHYTRHHTSGAGATAHYFYTAFTDAHGGTASARAYGIDQHAHGPNASDRVQNFGTVMALASASDGRLVKALAKGINQDAGGIVLWNDVHNSDYAEILARATAHNAHNYASAITQYEKTGTAGTYHSIGEHDYTHGGIASARAYGIDQHGDEAQGTNDVYNAGVIFTGAGHYYQAGEILAFADASEANYAFAQAKGINQVGSADTSANNYASNYDAVILASAHAHGGRSGYNTPTSAAKDDHDPTVWAQAWGVEQRGDGETADNYVVNNFVIDAYAKASNAYNYGYAYAAGIGQYANGGTTGDESGASNYVANVSGGLIRGSATAKSSDKHFAAGHTTPENAFYAQAIGIDQYARANNAHNSVVNSGEIYGSAFASSGRFVYATGTGVRQAAYEDGTSNAHVNQNFVDNHGLVVGDAAAHLAEFASASAHGVYQYNQGSTPHNLVHNSIDAEVEGIAFVSAKINGEARAYGAQQYAAAHHYASNQVVNTGNVFTFTTNSHSQSITHVVNGGRIVASANALAEGDASNNDVFAGAFGVKQNAYGYTGAYNEVDNEGLVRASGAASHAHSYDVAQVVAVDQFAEAGGALYQHATNHVDNDGAILAFARADGYCKSSACTEDRRFPAFIASARATGIFQEAQAYSAYNSVSNGRASSEAGYHQGGRILADARAQFAFAAYAQAHAISQVAEGHGFGTANGAENSVSASGTIEAKAFASGGVYAGARAGGIDQFARAFNTVTNEVFNSGRIEAFATAVAGDPTAVAYAAGVNQSFTAHHAGATLTNTSNALIHAKAHARVVSGTYETAKAYAAGFYAHGHASTLDMHVHNYGMIEATAIASVNRSDAISANRHMYAGAAGIIAYNAYSGTHIEGVVEGVIANYSGGKIIADAYASGGQKSDTSTNAFITDTIAGPGKAYAAGVAVFGREFEGEVYNAGTIDAQAFGSSAHATAIRIGNNGYFIGIPDVVGEIVNDGGFLFASTGEGVFRSADGAATGVDDQGPGNAINVETAPNQISMFFSGKHGRTGEIVGNIEDAENPANWTNHIVVQDGITFFDGSINPELGGSIIKGVAQPAPSLPSLDAGGTLTISGTVNQVGTLWLPAKSASGFFVPGVTSYWGLNPVLDVAAYNQQGQLWLAVSGANSGTIWADATNLKGGTVGVIVDPYVLPANSTVYTVVHGLGGGLGTGTDVWAGESILNFPSSPLLSVMATYPSNTAVITLTRSPFNAPLGVGLTYNQLQVANGLEGGYATCVSAACTSFYQGIFQFTANEYPGALDMLSDSQAGEVAQSNVVSVNQFIDTIIDRLDSMASVLGAGGLAAPNGEGITVWGSPYGSWNNTASTQSGPSYTDSRAGIVLGADLVVPDVPTLVLGVAGNIENRGSFNFKNGNWADFVDDAGHGTSSGWDIAVYGRYTDTTDWDMPFYIKGSGTYGTYDDSTLRDVALRLLAPPSDRPDQPSPGRFSLVNPTSPGSPSLQTSTMRAKFNSTVWGVYGEGGVNVDVGDPDLNLTPFVGIRYIDSTSGEFSETSSNTTPGIAAAALTVNDASAKALVTYLGAELSTKWDMSNNQALLPSIRLAWAHNFEDPWSVNAYFQGVGPSSDFTIDASTWSRDSGLVDVDMSMLFMDNLMGTIGYKANINSTQVQQSVYGRLDVKF